MTTTGKGFLSYTGTGPVPFGNASHNSVNVLRSPPSNSEVVDTATDGTQPSIFATPGSGTINSLSDFDVVAALSETCRDETVPTPFKPVTTGKRTPATVVLPSSLFVVPAASSASTVTQTTPTVPLPTILSTALPTIPSEVDKTGPTPASLAVAVELEPGLIHLNSSSRSAASMWIKKMSGLTTFLEEIRDLPDAQTEINRLVIELEDQAAQNADLRARVDALIFENGQLQAKYLEERAMHRDVAALRLKLEDALVVKDVTAKRLDASQQEKAAMRSMIEALEHELC